jgi:hypothetical protein
MSIIYNPANVNPYPRGWHDPATLNRDAAREALTVLNLDIVTGTAFYGNTRDQVNAYRTALIAKLEQPIFTIAQLKSLLNCIETTADINGVYSTVQLENKTILKNLMRGMK